MGSAALDLAYVAAGRYGSRLHFWNLAERKLEHVGSDELARLLEVRGRRQDLRELARERVVRPQPVSGGAGQARPFAKFGKPARRLGHRVQHAHRFVENADTAILSHREILASRMLRSPARHHADRPKD